MGVDENCKLCGKPDSGLKNPYKPPPGKEFICSACVIKMMSEEEKKK